MDIDLAEDIVKDARENHARLNTWVAITVALLATFMGICKVKDDNIVQAMQQAQADKIDHWGWYQSLHVREELVQDELENLIFEQSVSGGTHDAAYKKAIADTKSKLEHITAHKSEVEAQAKGDQDKYDKLNYKDDQFDLSDALVAIAISLLAITALSQKRWLYFIALVPSSLGTFMGLCGLMGWHVHSDMLAALLS